MPIFDARDIISFPGGDNATDTVLGGVHLNLTALQYWNYTLFNNGTLSNGSWCMLTFEPYEPQYVFPNGSFINHTSCYIPLNPIGERGYTSIALAVCFGLALLFTLIDLHKHGRMFLPTEKRFRPIGRRWQWYWMIAMCATAFISLISNIDVDRYYLPEIPTVLNAFFWFLMNMCTLAAVWEAVRHWGSWMERQYIDPDPFALKQDDRRASFEFWAPLVFYLFWWLEFFMVIPRNWGNLELQRSPEQAKAVAATNATDIRLKVAAFFLLTTWVIIVVHLRHSIKHYKERNRGFINRAVGLVRFMPVRFMLLLPLSLSVIAYQALSAWVFKYTIMDLNGNKVAMFVGGYAPALLILLVQIVAGFINPNEDQELIRQRRRRGADADRDLGIVNKPRWWRRLHGDNTEESMRDRIARNVREVGGGRPTARNIDRSLEVRAQEQVAATAAAESGADLEMGEIKRTESHASRMSRSATGAGAARPTMGTTFSSRSDRQRSEHAVQVVAGLLFPASEAGPTPADRRAFLMQDGPPPPPYEGDRGRNGTPLRSAMSERSNSRATTNSTAGPPQQIRSMLDV